MQKDSNIQKRKADHIQINLKKDVDSGLRNGLENFHFIHNALPEINLADVDCGSQLFNKKLSFPLLISSMTGGVDQAVILNQRLAEAAQIFQIAMGVGSQRAGIENPDLMKTFKVRNIAPDILLFANLGAIQLNYSYTIEHCKAAVDALQADAIILHLNPLQEALMNNGNTNFSGLLKKIEVICRNIPVPVVIKEVGWGISQEVARRLIAVGVQAIDSAGAGGTSWSEVEKFRSTNSDSRQIASAFKNWGIPTAQAILGIREADPDIPLIASGGINDGVEAAKCLALGADLVGSARMFLKAAAVSKIALHQKIEILSKQLCISMFTVGAKDLRELRNKKITRIEG